MKAYHLKFETPIDDLARDIVQGAEKDFWILGQFHLDEIICRIGDFVRINNLTITSWAFDLETATSFREAFEKGTIKSGDFHVGSMSAKESVEYAGVIWSKIRIHRSQLHCKFFIAELEDGRTLCATGSSNTYAQNSSSCHFVTFDENYVNQIKEALKRVEKTRQTTENVEQEELDFGGLFE